MVDHGEPGVEDLISITIWNRQGGLWYASNWDGTSTVLQLLDAGNIQVHTNNSFKITSEEESGSFECMVYPNPNHGQFTLELNGETNDVYHIKVTDIVGHEFYIESILAPKGGSTHSFDLTRFSNGLYIMSIENDKERQLITVMVQN